MPPHQTVLLVGGTGRTGQRVLAQLLSRGISVHVVVRSAQRLPADVAKDSKLRVVEADLLSLSDPDLLHQLRGCDAVISCLGHVISLRGVFGPPRDLVTRATTRLCQGIEALRPERPVKFILMTSVSVNHPGGVDTRRGPIEKAIVRLLRAVLPPARDNQRAADFLHGRIGQTNSFAQWAAVRPDTLLEGDVSDYTLHESLVSSLFAPGSTNMSNVAHFMCELATNPKVWDEWKGKLPVIINAPPAGRPARRYRE
jgi:NAD(P)-dependent dehydrogenase (short-subunit alcohol dehydrogenase family)